MAQSALETAGSLLAIGSRRFPPWWRFRLWHYLHKSLLGDPYWCAAEPERGEWRRVQPHGYEMELLRSDWMERYALQTGSFYADEVVAVVTDLLRPRDIFIDVGANIGFVTLCAARVVGPDGRVFSVEANPALVERLQRTVVRNQITNVEIIPCAAGDRIGSIGLSQDAHHGNNHLIADVDAAPVVVPMRPVDDMLRGMLPSKSRLMVKIDVEGAEMLALRGMSELLARDEVAVLVEIGDQRLRQAGSSAIELFEFMRGLGFEATKPSFAPWSFGLRAPILHEPQPRPEKVYDVLFRKRSDRQSAP